MTTRKTLLKPAPALKLSTTQSPLPPIDIDGVLYPMARPESFSLETYLGIKRLSKRIRGNTDDDDMSADEIDALSQMLKDEVAAVLPGAPVESLTDIQRLQIVDVFSREAGLTKATPPISKSSPSSNGSTEAPPATG